MEAPPTREELSRMVGGCAPLALRSVRRLAQGWDNHVFRVDRDYAVKVSKDEQGARKLLKEGCVIRYARARLGEVAPKLVALCGGVYRGVERTILVYEWIAGRTLAEKPRRARSHLLCAALAKTLREVHEMGVPEECVGLVPSYTTPKLWAGFIRGEAHRLIEMARGRVGSGLAEAVLARVEEHARLLEESGFQPKSVHGDIDPRNILVDRGGRLVGLIDWGEFAVGDPAIDYAGLFFDPHLGRHVLELQTEEEPGSLIPRVRFHWAFVPLYWAAYGVARGDRGLAALGLKELASRLLGGAAW